MRKAHLNWTRLTAPSSPLCLTFYRNLFKLIAFFLLLARNSSFKQLVWLSAFFATVLLKIQTQIFAELASALYLLVVCCEKLIHWGLWGGEIWTFYVRIWSCIRNGFSLLCSRDSWLFDLFNHKIGCYGVPWPVITKWNASFVWCRSRVCKADTERHTEFSVRITATAKIATSNVGATRWGGGIKNPSSFHSSHPLCFL